MPRKSASSSPAQAWSPGPEELGWFTTDLHAPGSFGNIPYFDPEGPLMPPAAEKQLAGLGLTSMVDRIVVVRSSTPTSVPWSVITRSILLAVLGIALLDRAARKRRAQPPTAAASTTSAEPGSRP